MEKSPEGSAVRNFRNVGRLGSERCAGGEGGLEGGTRGAFLIWDHSGGCEISWRCGGGGGGGKEGGGRIVVDARGAGLLAPNPFLSLERRIKTDVLLLLLFFFLRM